MRQYQIRWALGMILFQVAIHHISSHLAPAMAQPVVAWGDNQYGQCDIPPDLTNAVAVAGGELHSLALLRDGRVVGWGAGTNNTGAYPHHGQACPPVGLSNVVAIAARGEHSLALQQDGTVVAWGWNYYSQASVPAGLSNVVAISAGVIHNLALRADGTVAAWGYNDYGQCDVPEGLSNVVAIAAGYRHSVALTGNGRVVAWGGDLFDRDLAKVPPGLENVVAIAASDYHTLAMRADGSLVAWGGAWNTAAVVPEGLGPVAAVVAGSQHSLALRPDGTLAVWGYNYYHQTNLPAGLTGIVAIACGHNHSVALVGDGAPFITQSPVGQAAYNRRPVNFHAQASGMLPLEYQWFLNGNPITGATNFVLHLPEITAGSAGDYRMQASNAFGVAMSEAAFLTVMDAAPRIITQPEDNHAFVGQSAGFWVAADGSGPLQYQWRCEGRDVAGATNDYLVFDPVQSFHAGQYAVVISNSCGSVTSINAHLEVSQVAAWGDYYTPPPPGLSNVVALAAGWNHCLALKEDGTVFAWGGNDPGQAEVPPGLSNVIAVAAGSSHSLALRKDGTVMAWGGPWTPAQTVPEGLTNVVAISAGGRVSLALKADGTVAAWGDDQYGQLQVPASATNIIALHTFGGHCLAVRGDHTVVAWGKNEYGEAEVPVGLRDIVAVAANGYYSLALKADGTLTGWGCQENWSDMRIPLEATNVVAISGGGSPHYLVLKQAGDALAWGYEEFGAERVPPGLPALVQVSAGGFYNLALIGNTAPFLVAPPVGRKTLAGSDVTFCAQATGSLPLSYQWSFNGAPLAGATNAWLDRPAVSTNETGFYTLMVSNRLGVTISTPALLDVIPMDGSPVILLEPQDQLGWPSAGASFRVLVGGAPTLSFQWQFNGANLPGATNATLDLENLSIADLGYYRVRISNAFGEITSAPAFLGVLDYGAALNTTGLVWLTSIDVLWTVDPWTTHDGSLAARAGGRPGQPASRLQTTVAGPGYLTFWWKANPAAHQLVFRMDDEGIIFNHGGGEWQQRGVNLPAGEHTLAWWCESEAWLDQVEFVPGTQLPPVITMPPKAQAACRQGQAVFDVEAVGTPPLRYQWQFNSTNIAGATNQSLSLSSVLPEDAGNYSVIVANDYGAVTSTVAALHPLPLAYWGIANNRLLEFPIGLTNAVALAAGGYHCLALKDDGTVLAWGETDNNQCQVPAGLSNVVAISVGWSVSLALNADGRVTAWGHYSVTNVPPHLAHVVAIAAGGCHALVLQADGTVVGWGYESPEQSRVPPGLSNVVNIVAGYMHNLALKTDGRVVSWGSSDPIHQPPPDLTNAIALAVGYVHSLALKSDGTVVAWGENFAGQTNVPSDLTNVIAIAAGYSSSLALCADGRVIGWGDNAYGQIDGPCEPLAMNFAAGWHHGLAMLGTPPVPARVSPIAHSGTTFRIELPTERGKFYRLEYKNSLSDPQWILQPPQLGDGTLKTLSDPTAMVPQRFYRIYRQP